jgi:hypothetical protein
VILAGDFATGEVSLADSNTLPDGRVMYLQLEGWNPVLHTWHEQDNNHGPVGARDWRA